MCKYTLLVELCGCRAPDCRHRPNTLGQRESSFLQQVGGHVYRIISCYRDGNLCIHSFYNNDPNRLLVYYGMNPQNGNSTQDCTRKTFQLDPKSTHRETVCHGCRRECRQPAPHRVPTEADIWDVPIEEIPLDGLNLYRSPN